MRPHKEVSSIHNSRFAGKGRKLVIEKSSINPDKIAGFTVGEGCFYVEFGKDGTYRNKIRVRPSFVIELVQDDIEILNEIKRIMDCGNVYTLDFGRYQKYKDKNWKPHARFKVSNFADISEKVIPFFEQHSLFGKKQRAFEFFAQVCELMKNKAHLQADGLHKIKPLVDQLRQINKRGV